MTKRKFDVEFIDELLWRGKDHVRVNSLEEKTRWSDWYRLVFEHEGKLWETSYERGATEMQEVETPDYYECFEVEAFEKTVTDYREVKDEKEAN